MNTYKEQWAIGDTLSDPYNIGCWQYLRVQVFDNGIVERLSWGQNDVYLEVSHEKRNWDGCRLHYSYRVLASALGQSSTDFHWRILEYRRRSQYQFATQAHNGWKYLGDSRPPENVDVLVKGYCHSTRETRTKVVKVVAGNFLTYEWGLFGFDDFAPGYKHIQLTFSPTFWKEIDE